MPIIYVYLGIKIGFYSNEHEPIHIHATYNGAVIKITLFSKDNIVYRVSYIEEKGKFNQAKLNDLKVFISLHKNTLYYIWQQFFNNNVSNKTKIKTIIITKKIK